MITMTRAQWLSILVPCARVASKKPIRPGDACVLVTSDNEGVRAEAGDGFAFARAFRSGAESTTVQFAVDAFAIVERVKAMPDGGVTVTPRGSSVEVKAGSRKFSLPTMHVDDMQAAPVVDGDVFESLDRAMLEPIAIARHAVSTDDTRPHVASVLVELSGTASRAVATDGHRLTIARIGNVGGDAVRFLVPRNAAALLAGIPEGERVDLEVGGGLLAVTTHGDAVVTLTAKLTDAQFPPWEQVVPKDRKAKEDENAAALKAEIEAENKKLSPR
jgi:DNA polymerase-3 subunit beta